MNDFRGGGHVISSLERFEWGPPATFLGVPEGSTNFQSAGVVILPVPYEATVSYMSGTRFGPRGIIDASRYIELYDHESDSEPYTQGVFTLPELILDASGPEQALAQLGQVMEELLAAGKFVILLGGEHSLSSSPILAHVHGTVDKLSVLQLDAHADLRVEYGGTPYSHACVMNRVYRDVNLVPIGIRSLTSDEMALVREHDIPMVFSHELNEPDLIDRVLGLLGDHVYLTFDIDFFDPSLMPSTGTPEPGGGTWQPTIDLLKRVFQEKHVVGCDVVELSPLAGFVAPDFLAAKLVHKLIGFHQIGK